VDVYIKIQFDVHLQATLDVLLKVIEAKTSIFVLVFSCYRRDVTSLGNKTSWAVAACITSRVAGDAGKYLVTVAIASAELVLPFHCVCHFGLVLFLGHVLFFGLVLLFELVLFFRVVLSFRLVLIFGLVLWGLWSLGRRWLFVRGRAFAFGLLALRRGSWRRQILVCA
jgi:hypothetical protein